MVRNIMSLLCMNSPNLILRITSRIKNIALVILRHGSLALNKVRQSFMTCISVVVYAVEDILQFIFVVARFR